MARQFELEDYERLLRIFDPRVVEKALVVSTQKTALKTRTKISKLVRNIYNVKARDIPKVTPKRIGSDPPEFLLLYAGKRIGLEKFGLTERSVSTRAGRRKAAYVRVKKAGGRKLVKGVRGRRGFGAPVKGGRLIFERETDKKALPISRLTGPAVAQLVGARSVLPDIEKGVSEEIQDQFDHNLAFFLDRAAGR